MLSLPVVSKWCPSAEKYGLLPLFAVSTWSPSAKKYDLLPLFVISELRSEMRPSAKKYVVCGFGVVPSAKKYDLLPLTVVRSGGQY